MDVCVVHSFHFAVSCHVVGLLSGLPMALSKAGTSSLCLLVEADINATNSLYVNFEKTLEDVKYILFRFCSYVKKKLAVRRRVFCGSHADVYIAYTRSITIT